MIVTWCGVKAGWGEGDEEGLDGVPPEAGQGHRAIRATVGSLTQGKSASRPGLTQLTQERVPQSSRPWVTPAPCSMNLCASLGISLTRPEVTLCAQLSSASVTKAHQQHWPLALIPSELKLGPFPGQGHWTRSPPSWYRPSHWGSQRPWCPSQVCSPWGQRTGLEQGRRGSGWGPPALLRKLPLAPTS